MSAQPEALRLADILEKMPLWDCDRETAAELRRLHHENADLRAQLEAIGAGGVEPRRDHFPGATEMVPVGWAISYDGKNPHSLWTAGEGDLLDLEVKRQGGTARKMELYARVEAWNAQASETNQWDSLGEDEKIDWALKFADQFCDPTKMMQAARQALKLLLDQDDHGEDEIWVRNKARAAIAKAEGK